MRISFKKRVEYKIRYLVASTLVFCLLNFVILEVNEPGSFVREVIPQINPQNFFILAVLVVFSLLGGAAIMSAINEFISDEEWTECLKGEKTNLVIIINEINFLAAVVIPYYMLQLGIIELYSPALYDLLTDFKFANFYLFDIGAGGIALLIYLIYRLYIYNDYQTFDKVAMSNK